jgi:hypothetical protein
VIVTARTAVRVTMADGGLPATTEATIDANVLIETVVTEGGRTEVVAARTTSRTTTGTVQRATTPTLPAEPSATDAKRRVRALVNPPVTSGGSTTVLRVVADAMTAGNGATTGPAPSTTTTGIVPHATIPISPSDNRATDATPHAPEAAPPTTGRKVAERTGVAREMETDPTVVGVTTATGADPTVVGVTTATGAGPTVVGVTTATGTVPTVVGVTTATGAVPQVAGAMNGNTVTMESDATATTATMGPEAVTAEPGTNAQTVNSTAEPEARNRVMHTIGSRGISETDPVDSNAATTIEQGAAA